MFKSSFLPILGLCFLLVFSAFTSSGEKEKRKTKKETPTINWISLEKAQELSKENPKKVLIDIYADWCGWCKRMDKTTFQHPEIVDYVNDNFYAVKFDAEMKEVVNLGGKEYKYITSGRRGAHEIAVALLDGNIALPSTVIMDENLKKIQVLNGYLGAKDMDKVLHYFGDGYFEKRIPQGMFESKFKSSIKE